MHKNIKNHLVTQSNKLIESRYTLTLYEQRIVLLLASMVEINDHDFKEYIIDFNDLISFLHFKSKGIQVKFQRLLKLLRSRVLTIDNGEKGYLITGWISSAEYNKEENLVKLCFDNKLKPYLLELRKNFTKQRLGILIQFKSIYTIRIYALLKQYEKIGERKFYLDEFKKILDLENKYSEYKNFRRRVIAPAQKEFNKKDENGCYLSDINFTLKTKRKGRKIDVLQFIIFKQKNKSPTIKENQIEQIKISQIIIDYEEFGVMRDASYPYYKERGEQSLRNTLEYFKKEKTKRNIQDDGAYLMTLLKANAGQQNTARANNQPKILTVPNTQDGSQLQAWAIANGLPAAPIGYNTEQYRQMLCDKLKASRSG